MKHIKLFENFEITEPIKDGEPLNNREINILQGYNVMYPEWISKDDNYYYIFNHRCENIKDVPEAYIHAVCGKYNITNYTINDDHTVDVKDVYLFNKSLTKLPLKFNIVSGNFNCSFNNMTTLEGGPTSVGGNFYCSFNNITTLLGSPKEVGGNFSCDVNELTTLEGGPQSVGGNFDCSSNRLTTLKGIPKSVGRNFDCSNNKLPM
jgi:hypothetical protein